MYTFFNYITGLEVEPIILILALIIIDYILGLVGALTNGNFSSSKMREGLVHKFTYLVVMFVALIIERLAFHYDIGLVFSAGFFTMVCVWIIMTELGSILENLVVINPKFADNAFMAIFAKREKVEEVEKLELEEAEDN